MTNNLHSAFVLLARPYRETSLLIDFLTKDEGRISVIARGVRRKKSNWKAILQSFISLTISYGGKSDLGILYSVEQNQQTSRLQGRALMCGFYMNELLHRVLHRHDPCSEIFDAYIEALQNLNSSNDEIVLRKFEKKLLHELGYGLQIKYEVITHLPIESTKYYYFTPHHGCTEFSQAFDNQVSVFSGKHLSEIDQDNLDDPDVLKSAKRLMRLAFQPLLGDKPLKRRELFVKSLD